MQIGMRSEVTGVERLKPEALPARYWRWAEPKQMEQAERMDGVELSLRARWMNQLMANTPVNCPGQSERIAEVRAEIHAGTYESPAKLDVALDRLIDHAID